MLSTLGADSTETLFDEIPAELRIDSLDNVPVGMSEAEVSRLMRARAAQGWRCGVVYRCRCIRASYSCSRLGYRDPGRILQRLYAIPGGSQPGYLAGHLRISVDDDEPDRSGCFQCIFI